MGTVTVVEWGRGVFNLDPDPTPVEHENEEQNRERCKRANPNWSRPATPASESGGRHMVFRPLPLRVGEDTWFFDPDPGKGFFSKLTAAGHRMKKMEDSDNSEEYEEAFDQFTAALASGLQPQNQADAFTQKGYGLKVLRALVEKVIGEQTDLPTRPSQGSGTKRRSGGGS